MRNRTGTFPSFKNSEKAIGIENTLKSVYFLGPYFTHHLIICHLCAHLMSGNLSNSRGSRALVAKIYYFKLDGATFHWQVFIALFGLVSFASALREAIFRMIHRSVRISCDTEEDYRAGEIVNVYLLKCQCCYATA